MPTGAMGPRPVLCGNARATGGIAITAGIGRCSRCSQVFGSISAQFGEVLQRIGAASKARRLENLSLPMLPGVWNEAAAQISGKCYGWSDLGLTSLEFAAEDEIASPHILKGHPFS